ncbi:hypothetical protein DRQ36_02295 [bacterium]|nr:MAG: hypothetical protein DRQ36_02295 [bacterium]
MLETKFIGVTMSIYRDFVNKAVSPESVVLDLGCGDGKYGAIREISVRPKILIGLDNDEGLIKENSYLAYRVLGDAHNLPFRQNSFDLIITREVFEHIENPDTVLFEAARVLKANGKMIIQTPNKLNPISFLSSILSLKTKARLKRLLTNESKIEGNYKTYYRCNTSRKLSHTLRRNGFSVESLVYERIGLDWIKNPIIKAAFIIFQKITKVGFLRCFRQQIICAAKKTE